MLCRWKLDGNAQSGQGSRVIGYVHSNRYFRDFDFERFSVFLYNRHSFGKPPAIKTRLLPVN